MARNIRPRFPHLDFLTELYKDDLFIIRRTDDGFDREIRAEDLFRQIGRAFGLAFDPNRMRDPAEPVSPDARDYCWEAAQGMTESFVGFFGTEPVLNFDCRVASSLTLDADGRVAEWRALPNPYHPDMHNDFYFYQDEPSRRPTWVEKGIGGCPSIRFEGNSFMWMSSFLDCHAGGQVWRGLNTFPVHGGGSFISLNTTNPCGGPPNCINCSNGVYPGGDGITVQMMIESLDDDGTTQELINWRAQAAVAAWQGIRLNSSNRVIALSGRGRTSTPESTTAQATGDFAENEEAVIGMRSIVTGASSIRRVSSWKNDVLVNDNTFSTSSSFNQPWDYVVNALADCLDPALCVGYPTSYDSFAVGPVGTLGARLPYNASSIVDIQDNFKGYIGQIVMRYGAAAGLADAEMQDIATLMQASWAERAFGE